MSRAPARPTPAEPAARAFASHERAGATYPLVLAAVTAAVIAMHLDDVAAYSDAAFWTGVGATVALALGVGRAIASAQSRRGRIAATLLLPTAAGAFAGALVQAVVLATHRAHPVGGNGAPIVVRDLGGLVDTSEPVTWVAGGLLLGAVPALVVAVFLALAARAARRLVGNDASEGVSVAYAGTTGLAAAYGLLVVRPAEALPLVLVCGAAAVSVLAAWAIDGARIRFVRAAFDADAEAPFQVLPAERFGGAPGLAPVVTSAAPAAVIVHVRRTSASYRAAAVEPVALVAASADETTRPLRRRRAAGAALLFGMAALGALAATAQGAFGAP